MSWRKPGILIPDLYLYNIKIQTDIDQNEVKILWKIIFFKIIFEEIFFSRAGPNKPGRVTSLNQWPDWLLNASVREPFTHTCYSHNVIKLHLHSVCAIINGRRKNETLTWLTTVAGGNPSWACRWDSEKKLWCHSLSCSVWFLVLEKGKLMVMLSSSTGFLFPPLSLCFPICHLFWVFFFPLSSAGAVVMENGIGCWTKQMMSWQWCWQCWCGSLPSFFLSSVVPLWFSLPFHPLFIVFLWLL